MFCKCCGSEIKEDQTACPKCGKSINEEVMAENEEKDRETLSKAYKARREDSSL